MSALLDTLLADQMALRGETIPGLLVEELTPDSASTREQRLMADNAEQRLLIEALRERNDVLARRVADLSQDLRTLKGENATPQSGCSIATITAGDSVVLVEYDYLAAEDAVLDVESPLCGPGHPEEITPLNVFINGKWSDLGDVRAALDDERLIERIGDGMEA